VQGTSDATSIASIIKSWVELYSDGMYSWAFYKTSNKETAEDLVQEAFLAAIQAFEKFERKSNPKTWLFAILNNKITDHYRRQMRNPTASELQQNEKGTYSLFERVFDSERQWEKRERPKHWQVELENILDNPDFNKVLKTCMDDLPATWYSAVQLKYLEEKKGELICHELQITPSNFWQILHRAKLQLRKCLEVNWFKS
jgi:RNA polymerase sigma-70 factor (ECF subfamily)